MTAEAPRSAGPRRQELRGAPGRLFASSLAPLAPDDIWAVHGDDLSHWDGTAWTRRAVLPGTVPETMSAVDAFGRCDLLIVGTRFPVSFFHGDALALRYR